MEPITLPVYNSEGKEVEKIDLDAKIFDGEINKDAIYQAVVAYRARQRTGLASTKTRGEVSGGGRKPWKQKGTGRARVGSIRSPLWRHGGVVFGPHPRDFAYELSPKIKNLALKSGLNAKVKENRLTILDDLKIEKPQTKAMVKIFGNLKVDLKKVKPDNVLLYLGKVDEALKLSLRNIDFLKFHLAIDANVYDVLNARQLIITKDGLSALSKRLK